VVRGSTRKKVEKLLKNLLTNQTIHAIIKIQKRETLPNNRKELIL
jgi:hypothetical protein